MDVPLLIVCTWWMYLMRVLSESPHVTVVVDVLVQRLGASPLLGVLVSFAQKKHMMLKRWLSLG